MDIIGEAGPAADAELIAAAIDIMRAFGFGPTDVHARISDRRVLRTLLLGGGLTEAQLPTAFEVIDKSERVPGEALAEILGKAGIGKREAGSVFAVANLRSLDAVSAALAKVQGGEEAGESLRTTVAALGTLGLGEFVSVDLTIVRGLAYYDNLIKEIAGIDLPCAGFGMGDVVLGELLAEHRKQTEAPGQLDAFLVAVGGEDVAPVLTLAAGLRDRGLAVEYALRNQPIRKQLELAAARGAPRAVIIGPDERKAKVAVVRDLKTGKQRKVALTKVRKGVFK